MDFFPDQYAAYDRFIFKKTTEPLSDFSVQIKLLIQTKNRLQNSHPMAFKNNLLFFLKVDILLTLYFKCWSKF